ncbi:unnamed protein product [Closterium sp. NIES-54]
MQPQVQPLPRPPSSPPPCCACSKNGGGGERVLGQPVVPPLAAREPLLQPARRPCSQRAALADRSLPLQPARRPLAARSPPLQPARRSLAARSPTVQPARRQLAARSPPLWPAHSPLGVLLLLEVLRVPRHDGLPDRSLSPRSSCASGLLNAHAFGVELPELEALPLGALELEVLKLLVLAVLDAGGATSGGTGVGGTVQWRPFFVPPPPSSLPPPDSVLRQVLSLPSSTGLPPSLLSPPPCHSQPQLQPDSPLPNPSPYAEQTYSFTERREPESRPASPVRAVRTGRRVPRPRPPPVHGTHIMALRPSSVPLRVPLLPPPESSLPAIPDPGSDLARAASPNVSCLLAIVVTDPSFESTATSTLVAELVDFAAACRLDYAGGSKVNKLSN